MATSADAADAIFLGLVERDPVHPGRALAAFLAEAPRAPGLVDALERLLRDYERGGIADPDVERGSQLVEQALDSVAANAPLPVSTEIPDRLGNYRVIRTLSLSPSSAVLLAEQEAPIQREVAIKLLFEDASEPRFAARVEAERQTLASLEHPNIARIYDYGIGSDHRPYMVMEHVGGGSIVEYCRSAGLPLSARVELFLDACAAIRTAHTLGVLHCDLKPANILVQIIGGEPHAKVIDFGIARTVRAAGGERTQLAGLPHAIGTLASMSPEALVPGGPPLDTRADVFGLGLVLLELAALQPPRALPRDNIGAALQIVLEEPIPRAVELARGGGQPIDGDLDAVIAKATARDKRERYDSIDAFVRDLQRWLSGDAVTARERLLAERVRRGFARRRLPILLAAAMMVALAPLIAREFEADAARDRALEAGREALALAIEVRDVPGKDLRRSTLLTTVAEETRAGLLVSPDDVELLKLRAAGIEEALMARLMRADAKTEEARTLATEAEKLRRQIVSLAPSDLQALADLSVALAYKLDTIRGEPGFFEMQEEQFSIDRMLHERDPTSRLFADNLSWTYQRVGDRTWERGERELALSYFDRSAETGEAALAIDPQSSVSLFTAAAGHIYAMHADWVRGDEQAARQHVFRSLQLSGQLLAREPEHARGGAFHLRAASFASGFLFDPQDQSAPVALLDRALAAVAGNKAAVENTAYMGFPYFDAVAFRVMLAIYQADLVTAKARAAEARSLVERERYVGLRSAEFNGWAATVAVLEGWIALCEGDVAEFQRALGRGFDEARTMGGTPDRRMQAAIDVAGRMREILQVEGSRIADAATLARLEEIRAWVVSELDTDIVEVERDAPELACLLIAKAVRARLVGDERLADEFDAKVYFAPNTSYQQAAGGPPGKQEQ